MNFEESSVIITGGNKGIGLSIAKVFARQTNRPIVLVARNKEQLKQARNECLKEGASSAHTVAADLIKADDLLKFDFSELNPGILINNAGSFLFKPLEETAPEEFNMQFQINAMGAFNMTQQVLPELHKLERSLIVNICSQASLAGTKDSGAYSASKHATLGYTRSLRKELMDSNIAVTAINLGQTYSTSWEGVNIDPNNLIDPEDVGKLIVSLSLLSARSVAEEIILKPQGGEVAPM
ncbi:MAG: SDR family oxidoreductase [Balneolaceae bacterium]|nr:SDR family oxidoreductase [Balneolaceae bacterium]